MSIREIKDSLATASSKSEFVRLDLDEIYFNPELNVREDYGTEEDETVEALAMSIEATGGITTPMQVVQVEPHERYENKEYILNSGFRRYRALTILSENEENPEYAEIFGKQQPCMVMHPKSRQEMQISQLIENLQRKNLNPIEEMEGVCEVLNTTEGLKANVLAKLLGISVGKMSQYVKMNELPDTIKDMISSGEISFSHARIILYNVPKTSWLDAAKIGKGLSYGKFESLIESKYKTGEDVDSEAVGEAKPDGDNKEEGGKQRTAKILRESEVKKFIPFIKDKAENSEDQQEKNLWSLRLDTINWILNFEGTRLGKELDPFIKEIEEKEKEQEKVKEGDANKKKFIKDLIKKLRELRNAMPADGERKNTMKEDILLVFAGIKKLVESIAAEKDEEKKKKLHDEKIGFDINLETFVKEELVPAWNLDVETRKAATKKRAETKKKKEEEKKAKEAEEKAKTKKGKDESSGDDDKEGNGIDIDFLTDDDTDDDDTDDDDTDDEGDSSEE